MSDGITLRLTAVERATLQLCLERYAADTRTVEESVSAEKIRYQANAAEIIDKLRGMPSDGEQEVEFLPENRIIAMAALTNRIYGCRDAAWRAEMVGDYKLGGEWRAASGKLEEMMIRLGGPDSMPSREEEAVTFPDREPEEADTGPGTIHGGFPG